MRVPANISRGSLGFNMTPMIDVVFLLIIFFLVSSHLAQQEVQLELDLPGAGTGQRAEQDDAPRRAAHLTGKGARTAEIAQRQAHVPYGVTYALDAP